MKNSFTLILLSPKSLCEGGLIVVGLDTGKVTSVRFGPDASYLAVGSNDRNLRIFGAPSAMTES